MDHTQTMCKSLDCAGRGYCPEEFSSPVYRDIELPFGVFSISDHQFVSWELKAGAKVDKCCWLISAWHEQWHKRAITCPVYVAIEPPIQVGIYLALESKSLQQNSASPRHRNTKPQTYYLLNTELRREVFLCELALLLQMIIVPLPNSKTALKNPI